MKTSRILGTVLGGILFASITPSALAAVVMASNFGENDCSGFFGQGFDNCQIFDDPNSGQTIELSPVIISFEEDLSVGQINTLYESVDGTEFDFSNLATDNSTGTWTYTPDDLVPTGEDFDPATDDPGIRYWVAKATNDFKLFWEVPDDVLTTNGGTACNPDDAFTIACLDEALVVTTGDWTTPLAGSGNPAGLSHLTFYDTEPPREVPPPPPGGQTIPEPSMLGMLGLGLLGAGFSRRRRKLA